ncbi:MAG: response regulator [Candidatus ainarchaeum sp.]|nr:response regulator [Candidatus ainarchaeum sp.]
MMIHDSGKPAGDGRSRPSGFGTEPASRGSSGSGGAGWSGGQAFKPAPDRIEKPTVVAAERVNYTVLVVDGDSRAASTKKGLLREHGYSVETFNSIEKAVEAAGECKPSAIVIDTDTLGLVHGADSRCDMTKHVAGLLGPLKDAAPGAKILVLDVEFCRTREDKLVKAGADGVIDIGSTDKMLGAVDGLMPVIFAQPVKTSGKTVLIMFEDALLAEPFQKFIIESGYDVIIVGSYEDVPQKAAGADLIIMDLGENWEAVQALSGIMKVKPDAKVIIRLGLETTQEERGFLKVTGFLPALTVMEDVEAALARHLPLASKPQKKETADLPVPARPVAAKKNATILVVDDEPQLTQMTKVGLEMLGYTVTTAANGAKGLEAYRTALAAGTPPDVVISDREMPEMCGADMAREIKKLNPAAKVIFVTGYSEKSDLIPLEAVNPFAILAKPFTVEELAKVIERALSG